MKRILRLFGAAVALALPSLARGQVLTFENIVPAGTDYVPVGDYYNGSGGPDYGITFSSNALAACLQPRPACGQNASRGGLGDPNSQFGELFFLTGASTYMNGANGFTDGFSFYYTSPFAVGGFTVWSGLNGTGVPLATAVLPTTTNGSGDPNCYYRNFCPYYPFGVNFVGTAYSVTFEGAANQIGFDDVTFGSSTPGNVVPEPATMGLVGTGLLGLFGARFRRRKSA